MHLAISGTTRPLPGDLERLTFRSVSPHSEEDRQFTCLGATHSGGLPKP